MYMCKKVSAISPQLFFCMVVHFLNIVLFSLINAIVVCLLFERKENCVSYFSSVVNLV